MLIELLRLRTINQVFPANFFGFRVRQIFLRAHAAFALLSQFFELFESRQFAVGIRLSL